MNELASQLLSNQREMLAAIQLNSYISMLEVVMKTVILLFLVFIWRHLRVG